MIHVIVITRDEFFSLLRLLFSFRVMAAEEAEYELQQLVSSDEEPPGSKVIKPQGSTSKKSRLHKSASDRSYRGNKVSLRNVNFLKVE